MEKVFGWYLADEGVQWVETAAGLPWKVDLGEPIHRWMVYGDYADTGFLTWARSTVPSDGVIVDSGSNIGQFLPYFASIVPEGRILAYEPSDYCCQWIENSLARQKKELPIEVMPCALGASNGVLWFEDKDLAGHGLWGSLRVNCSTEKKVPVRRLDEELGRLSVNHVNLWKLDVEGHEVHAIRGARSLLENNKIDALFVELKTEDDHNHRVVETLRAFGYNPYRINRRGSLYSLEEVPSHEIDALFLPE